MTYLEHCFSILKILNIRGYSSSDILFVRIAGLQCIAHNEGDVLKIILVIQHLSTSPFVQQARLSIRSLANHDHYSGEIRIAIFFLTSLQRLWPCSRRKSYFNHIWATCGRELQRKIDLSSYAFFQQGNFLFSSNLQGSAQRIEIRARYYRHPFQKESQQSKCLVQDISLFHVMNLFCPFALFAIFFIIF